MIRISVRVARQRIRVIYNPVIPPDLAELARQPVEHPWFSPACPAVPRHAGVGNGRLLLAAGRLTPQKDFSTLLRALKIVRQNCDVRLVILGEGKQRAHLESLVKELGLESVC